MHERLTCLQMLFAAHNPFLFLRFTDLSFRIITNFHNIPAGEWYYAPSNCEAELQTDAQGFFGIHSSLLVLWTEHAYCTNLQLEMQFDYRASIANKSYQPDFEVKMRHQIAKLWDLITDSASRFIYFPYEIIEWSPESWLYVFPHGECWIL